MNKLIYLDNAATSHPKPEVVYQAVDQSLRAGGSPGRGGYRLAVEAERQVFETREALAELFHAEDSAGFIFTLNATAAINQALFGLLEPGDRVVTTSLEHNSVVRPLRALQDRGVEVVKVAADPDSGLVSAADLKTACLEKTTRLLLVNHCSNVSGSLQPVKELGRWCRSQGLLFMLDGSQTAGCLPIDFKKLEVDLFAASGHKGLLGPAGTGFLYLRPGLTLNPLFYGGTGSHSSSDLPPEDLPDRFEAGTPNTSGIAGLQAAIRYLLQVGVANIRIHETGLIEKLVDGLCAIPGVKVYGSREAGLRGGAISFNLQGWDPAEVGFYLDQRENICVRAGLHCAPDAHRTLGTFPQGTIRVSPGYSSTEKDVDTFLAAVRTFRKAKL